MSKKRVHEIAKDLKGHGIELDNKEIVTELQSLGYDVKTHSSSLDDDQAASALQRLLEKHQPRSAPPPVAAKGFVVRRRAVTTPSANAPADAPLEQQEPTREEAPAEPVAASEPEVPVQQQVQEAPVAGHPEHQDPPETQEPATEAPVAAPPGVEEPSISSMPNVPPPEERPAPIAASTTTPATPVQSGPPPVAATPPVRRPGVQATVISRPPPAYGRPQSPPSRPSAQVISRPPPAYGRPQGPGQGGPGQHRPATVVSRPGVPGAPGAPRPGVPGATAQSVHPVQPGQAGQGGQVTQPPVDPRTLRPTATQAVVISRPLIQVRRVTPSSTAHKNIPMAPGKKALGERREFQVVPDTLGRGRELVDVSRNKDRRGAGRKPNEKEGSLSKQEITDLVWGRVTIPIRGKKRKPTKKGAKTQITEMAEEKKVIKLQEGISVSELGQKMGVKTNELVKKLMKLGKMVTANMVVDKDTAELVASDYGWKVEKVGFEVEDYLPEVEEDPELTRPRPPVVTVMGHVDHGKTSLLDAIRKATVASGEAGGITQHMGAYSVSTPSGDVTFLDTPGHEAFTAMRERGANITDVVILVVASDDGVMPQTIEAIKHAKAADVPIVVAINKMDLPTANLDRVKKELADQGLNPEEWGGDTIMVPVSAKTRAGLDLLLENVALQAEVLELGANPSRPAVGSIVESKLEKGRGPVATVLISEGTLRVGDAIVTGVHHGRVRAMTNSRGEAIKEVLPGYPAEVIGLSGVPVAGEKIHVVADERAATKIAEHRAMRERQADLGKTSKSTLEDLLAKVKGPSAGSKELRLVIKADVHGSVEAVAEAVNKLSTHKVKVEVIEKAVGMVTESDVMRAAASKGLVVGFNVRPESGAENAAKAQGVSIETYRIIYDLIDGVRKHMEALLEPIRTERKLGRAEVRMLVNVPKLGTIAGSAVLEGTIRRNSMVRVWRENKQVHHGKIASLRRFKDDVKEVVQGFECGIGIEGFSELKEGDIIEAYEIEETRPSLN